MTRLPALPRVTTTGWSIGVTQNESEFMAAAHTIRNMILIVGGIFLAVTVLGRALVCPAASRCPSTASSPGSMKAPTR